MQRRWLPTLGAVAALALLGGNGAFAQYNPSGWIQTDGWNMLVPLVNPYGCGGGGAGNNTGGVLAGNWLAPHDIGTENPKAGDTWTIDFGATALSTGWLAGAISPDPIWVTSDLLQTSFGLDFPNGDVVDYNGLIDFINANVIVPAGGAAMTTDNVLGVATTYVENTTGAPLLVNICTASDDSIVAYVNNARITDVSNCRGTDGDCSERRAAYLPPGISKIATLTYEGGGGWGFRLAIEVAGVKTSDTNGLGLVFLGPGGPSTVGQSQYDIVRTIPGSDARICENYDEVTVTLTGNGAQGGDDTVTLVERVSHAPDADVTISAASDGGTIANVVDDFDGIDLVTGAVQEFFVLGPIANTAGAGPGEAAVREAWLSIPDADIGTLTEGQVVNDRDAVAQTVRRFRVNNGDGLDFNVIEGDVDNIMHYAWTKLTLAAPTDVYIGVASDDSVQVLVDGVEVAICGNCPRGWGANGELADISALVSLTAGTHTIVTKTFEGGGGHGVRLIVLKPAASDGVGPGGVDCASATAILPGEFGIGDTRGAAVGVDCDPQLSGAHYYKVEGNGDTLTAQLCTSRYIYDGYLAIFAGTCDAAGCVAAVDDTCARQPLVTWASVAGTTYYIRVYGWDVSAGVYVLQVSDSTHPAVREELAPLTRAGVCADPDGVCDTEALTVLGKTITWNVSRADIDAGLSYVASTNAASVATTLSGAIAGNTTVSGQGALTLFTYPSTGPVGIFENFRDIGAPPTAGSLSFDGTTYTQKGSGGDIWDGGDDFSFAYKYVTGDFVATARITSRTVNPGGYRWGRHGLMARWDCLRDSKYHLTCTTFATAANVVDPVTGVENFGEDDFPRYQWRVLHRNAGNTREFYQAEWGTFGAEANHPTWMRLVRVGKTCYGYLSEDANGDGQPDKWVEMGSDSATNMPDTMLVGMAVQGRIESGATITYDNLTIEALSAPVLVATKTAEIAAVDFEQADGAPEGATVVNRAGLWTPQVIGGRLRITDESQAGSSTAVWYELPGSAALTQGGFVAEFDAYMFRTQPGNLADWNPADGMAVAVIGNYCPTAAEPRITSLPEAVFVGNDVGGASLPEDLGAGAYRSASTSGHDIWAGGDDFLFQYAKVTGDFDIAIEITNYTHSLGIGRWGKSGLMARQSDNPDDPATIAVERDSRYTMIQGHGPVNDDAARIARRFIHHNAGQVQEFGIDGSNPRPRFMRLTRRGNVVQGWLSNAAGLADGSLDPAKDCNWLTTQGDNWGPTAPETILVGFANSEHESDGAGIQTYEYRILNATAGEGRWAFLPFYGGDAGGGLGYHGGWVTGKVENHPSFAIELDNWLGGGEPGNEPAGNGSPDFEPSIHTGIDINGQVSSAVAAALPTPAFGVSPLAPPGNPPMHFEVVYAPNGQIDVFTSADGSPRAQILSYRIPPITGPIILGFTGGTGGAVCTQEVDNVVLSAVCAETPDEVSIAGAAEIQSTMSADYTATFSGADGAVSYTWSVVSGAVSIAGSDATVSVTANAVGPATIQVTASDATCEGTVTATFDITVTAPPGVGPFRRGDANNDGGIDLSDGVYILNWLFLGGPEPECKASADTNLQGEINLTSGIYVLNFLFLGGPAPPAPYPACGQSSAATDMTLGCVDTSNCP